MRYEGRRVLHCIVLYYIMIIIYKMYLIFNFKKSKGVNLNEKKNFYCNYSDVNIFELRFLYQSKWS